MNITFFRSAPRADEPDVIELLRLITARTLHNNVELTPDEPDLRFPVLRMDDIITWHTLKNMEVGMRGAHEDYVDKDEAVPGSILVKLFAEFMSKKCMAAEHAFIFGAPINVDQAGKFRAEYPHFNMVYLKHGDGEARRVEGIMHQILIKPDSFIVLDRKMPLAENIERVLMFTGVRIEILETWVRMVKTDGHPACAKIKRMDRDLSLAAHHQIKRTFVATA